MSLVVPFMCVWLVQRNIVILVCIKRSVQHNGIEMEWNTKIEVVHLYEVCSLSRYQNGGMV